MEHEPQDQDAQAVREFFDQWELYKKVAGENYLYHREAMAALSAWLDRNAVRSFLDLGCGDAFYTTGVLAGRKLDLYAAVDLSPIALGLARENAAGLGCATEFSCGDFFEAVRTMRGTFDMVFIGLSLHHLPRDRKGEFFQLLAKRLSPGGAFAFFEPTRREELREEYLDRWVREARETWVVLDERELDAVEDHVRSADYPETGAVYSGLAQAAGFDEGERIFADPTGFYTVMIFRRAGEAGGAETIGSR